MFKFFETAPSHTYLRGGTESNTLKFYKQHNWERQSSTNWDYFDQRVKNSTMGRKYNKKLQMRNRSRAARKNSNRAEARKNPYQRKTYVKRSLRKRAASRIIRQIKNEDTDVCTNNFEYIGALNNTTPNTQQVLTYMSYKIGNAGYALVGTLGSNATAPMTIQDPTAGTVTTSDSIMRLSNGTDTYSDTTGVGTLASTTADNRSAWELGTNWSFRDMLCYAEGLYKSTLQGGTKPNGLSVEDTRTAVQGYIPSAGTNSPLGNPDILKPFYDKMLDVVNYDQNTGTITGTNENLVPGYPTAYIGTNQQQPHMRTARLYAFNESISWTFTNTSEGPAKITIYECVLKRDVPLRHGSSSSVNYYEVGALPDPIRLWQNYTELNDNNNDNPDNMAQIRYTTGLGTQGYRKSIYQPNMTPMGKYIQDVYTLKPHVIYLKGGQTKTYTIGVNYNMGIKPLFLHAYYGMPGITRTFMMTICGVAALGLNKAEGLDAAGLSQRITNPTAITVKWKKTRRFCRIMDKQKHQLTLRAPLQTTFDSTVQYNEEDDDFQAVNTAIQELNTAQV